MEFNQASFSSAGIVVVGIIKEITEIIGGRERKIRWLRELERRGEERIRRDHTRLSSLQETQTNSTSFHIKNLKLKFSTTSCI